MNDEVNSNMSFEVFLSFIKEKIIVPDETKIIYQYTNIEALFNGIIVEKPKKTNKEICLWASHYMYLNDPSEIAIGQKYVEEILSQYFIEKDDNDSNNDSINNANCFITSFSTTIDSLPMWSMYGKSGAGIALGFDRDIIHKESESFLYKCVYLDKEIRDKIASFCESNRIEKIPGKTFNFLLGIGLLAFLYKSFKDEKPIKESIADEEILLLLQFMMFAKDPAYKYENEVRLILSDKDSKVKYRCQNNLIIPYLENFFPKKALKEIWVGPTNDMGRTVKSLETYLNHMGFSGIEIKKSEVPYRT